MPTAAELTLAALFMAQGQQIGMPITAPEARAMAAEQYRNGIALAKETAAQTGRAHCPFLESVMVKPKAMVVERDGTKKEGASRFALTWCLVNNRGYEEMSITYRSDKPVAGALVTTPDGEERFESYMRVDVGL